MNISSLLLLGLLVVPFATALVVAALGPRRLEIIRQVSLAASLISLLFALILAGQFALVRADSAQLGTTFRPEFVPGEDPGHPHTTTWDLITFPATSETLTGRPPAVQFYVGVDGLNLWLLVLTALLMVSAVLVSWNGIQERANEYYAWLLALEAGMLGVFMAFDIILFYVFFELTLVPLFFLIGIWGGPERRHAARKFFIYTLAGSLITLLGLLGLVLACYADNKGELTFSIPRLVVLVNQRLAVENAEARAFWLTVQFWAFLAMIAGFSIKVPLFPLHTWLPLAHVEAPTAGSVLLAGVLLKIGAYGYLRLCLPLAPDASLSIGVPVVGTLAVVGILYGAICALAQEDIKKLVAYSSVSHLGFCMLGMFALNQAGLSGSLLQMINHGLSTGALFLLVGMLYERYHTRLMSDYGGMAARLGLLACFMVFICLTSIGLPGLNGFIGEALVFLGMFNQEPVLAVVGTGGIVLGAWYLLQMLLRVFFGPVKEPQHEGHEPVRDLNLRELAALVPIAVACLLIGVYPQPLLQSVAQDIGVVAGITQNARTRAAEAQQAHIGNPLNRVAVENHRGEQTR
jgi:NADH-quinone oxidoreductase subunit M